MKNRGIYKIGIVKYLIFILLIVISGNSCSEKSGGEKTKYYESGQILEKRIFRNSKDTLDFISYLYYRNGNMKSVKPFMKGLLDGNVLDYYESGQLNIITHYLADTVFGINKVFAEDGELMRRSLYIQGNQKLFEQLFINKDLNMKKMELYKVEKGKGDKVGQIVYENGIVKNGWSLYCLVNLNDTMIFKKEYSIELEALTDWKDGYLEANIYQLNRNLHFIDSTKMIKAESKSLKLKFKITPDNLGYNLILGKALIKKDTIINGKENTLRLEVPFYNEFFVIRN
jgi:hypothetical protein